MKLLGSYFIPYAGASKSLWFIQTHFGEKLHYLYMLANIEPPLISVGLLLYTLKPLKKNPDSASLNAIAYSTKGVTFLKAKGNTYIHSLHVTNNNTY